VIRPDQIKQGLVAIALLVFGTLALAEKPQDKPYAAGSPFGGIPPWSPGEKFVGISGGSCNGTCPVYELYLFDDGRVIFVGRKDTTRPGVWKKTTRPDAYAELVATLVRTGVLDTEIKRRTCLKGRPMLTVMRSTSDTGAVRTVSLNSGCEGHADIVKEIETQFIDWTGVEKWL
jgi:hypothetical protein